MTLIADTRLRLIAALAVIVVVSQLESLTVAAIAAVAAMLLALAAGLDAHHWRRLVHVETFVVLLVVTLPFAVAGTPVFSFGPLNASIEGVMRAGLVALKVSASVLILMAFLGSVEPARIGAALNALKLPEPLVRVFVLSVRYVSLIRGEAHRLHDAMRVRAFVPRSNRHTWRSYGYLIGMLLVRALERAHRVEEAMACRGYTGRFPHATLAAPTTRDWLALAGLAALSVLMLLMDRL